MSSLEVKKTIENEDQMEPSVKNKSFVLELSQFIILAILIVAPIRMFVAQPFLVSGASMENTFDNGDYLIIDQLTYHFNDPKRGDVIIFRYPKDPSKFFIKRIIGIPGDTINIEDNVVTLTTSTGASQILDEPYVKAMNNNNHYNVTLDEGNYFVMGDNRDRSSDSRVWGVLDRENIIGRTFLRLFPFDHISTFPGSAHINLSDS